VTGTDFLGATAVDFGAAPAAFFTVDSDTQITATASAAATAGPVDITVTAHAGLAIPIKFSLGGNEGLGITPTGYPAVTQVSCSTGAPINISTLTGTADNSGLQYDPSTNTYTYTSGRPSSPGQAPAKSSPWA
jgi:hypothetical protein